MPDPRWQESWFWLAEKRIASAIAEGDWTEAQDIANAWADEICHKFDIPNTGVWKFFKRSIAARWFGRVENRRFAPGWSVDEALGYARSFVGRSVRFSLFSTDIASHATSHRLPIDRPQEWEQLLSQADNSIAMEVFPESSSPNSICFRRFTTCFGEEILYEAGKGQATYVFEQERGQHAVISAKKIGEIFAFRNHVGNVCVSSAQEIRPKLELLISVHETTLGAKSFGLCRMLGIDFVSIEGYFDPATDSVSIVDLDLPFDSVFVTSRPSLRRD
ncbi:MAG: hypothetical protein M1587_08240 [Thaumarchaeota archaeon]|nr:hypothetical protein [Nitrososphaerota archaeon]